MTQGHPESRQEAAVIGNTITAGPLLAKNAALLSEA
jgi:hypothetical protein